MAVDSIREAHYWAEQAYPASLTNHTSVFRNLAGYSFALPTCAIRRESPIHARSWRHP